MVVEITADILFGSMALLADGLHMASHAAALSITAIAYILARRLAHDRRFSFGSGKINALAGFTSAVLLVGFALLMAIESITRFFAPVLISFDQAIAVAVLGLIVNGISVFVLGGGGHGADHHHGASHHHDAGHRHAKHHGHADHNRRAAYLHVLADALTSVLAIGALLAGKFYGLIWMDPLMGIVGAILIARWFWSLLVQTSTILTDHEAPEDVRAAIQQSMAPRLGALGREHCQRIPKQPAPRRAAASPSSRVGGKAVLRAGRPPPDHPIGTSRKATKETRPIRVTIMAPP